MLMNNVMENQNMYTKSLELLDQFLSETSPDELSKLIEKHRNSGIEGPTYAEYLDYFQNEFASINWFSTAESSMATAIDVLGCGGYLIKEDNSYYVPPPVCNKNKVTKKDSANVESFFLV